MNIIFLLIPISLFIALIFIFLFIKSVRNGQYDDLQTPSMRMLFDDGVVTKNDSKEKIN